MSLLLEALKKAELAKQGTQPEPQPEPVAPAPELSLAEPHESIITRESLPDISQTLEISTEDFAARKPAAPRSSEPVQHAPEPTLSAPEMTIQPDSPVEPVQAGLTGSRDAARQMFDVKEVDYNPRRPFYITMGVLVLAGVGYGVYVWWQMQPHYTVNTAAVQNAPKAPPPTAPVAQAEPPELPPVPVAPAAAPSGPAAARTVRPAEPAASQKPVASPPLFVGAQGGAARLEPVSPPAPSLAAAGPQARSARTAEQAPIIITPPSAQVDPMLERAYSAYQSGNQDAAREEYQRVLERDPTSRDALLGLAAIDARARNYETAELRYLRLLEINPRDTRAHAGMIALQGSVDPVQYESRIKNLIATQPDAVHLYFTLGNLYAAQSRWAEAQNAYFKAYSSDPENADYAFNLAVSLDQLRQPKLALEHYRKALALAARQPAAFDRAQVETRARQLER